MKDSFIGFVTVLLIVCIGFVGFITPVEAALVFHSGFEIGDFTEWSSITGSPSVGSLFYIDESADYGGTIRAFTNDGTFVYAGGLTTETVRKYLMSNMSYIDESANYGGYIYALTNDGTFVYAGGLTTQKVRRYLMSNMSYIDESASYGGDIRALTNDGTYVYAGGVTTQTVRKYLMSNMSYIDESADYGGNVNALTNDGTYVYAVGSTTQTVRRYLISNMSYMGESASYGGNVNAITNSGTSVYAGGLITRTVRKYRTDAVRTGAYSMRASTSGAQAYVSSTGNPEIITFGLFIGSAPSGQTIIAGTTTGGNIRLTATLYVELYDGSTSRGTSTTQLSPDTWYRISAGLNSATQSWLAIDGTKEIQNVDTDSSAFTPNYGIFTAVTAELYFDDIAEDDTFGTADTGNISVELSQPNAIGNYSEYDTPVPSSTHYENVDNNPGDSGVDADYNEIRATGTYRDSYDIEGSSDLGWGGSDTVEAVSSWVKMKRDGGGGTDHMIMVRDNGSDYNTADLPLTTSFVWYNRYDNVMPNGGGSWTQTRFNDLEVGGYRSTAQDQHISNVQVMVAYIPAAATVDISNSPSSKGFGVVSEDTDYWSNDSAPTFPLDDSECYFTVTNSSGASVDITVKAINFTGGAGWTLVSGVPGSGEVRVRAGKSGDATEGAMIILTTSGQSFITGLADSASKKWEVKLETGTFTDGTLKESTITLTAVLS